MLRSLVSAFASAGLALAATFTAASSAHAAVAPAAAQAWGSNFSGQLGNGTSGNSSSTPVAVSGLGSGVTAVAAGSNHSLAIHNGAAQAWGRNSSGQVGNSTFT